MYLAYGSLFRAGEGRGFWTGTAYATWLWSFGLSFNSITISLSLQDDRWDGFAVRCLCNLQTYSELGIASLRFGKTYLLVNEVYLFKIQRTYLCYFGVFSYRENLTSIPGELTLAAEKRAIEMRKFTLG